MRFYLSIDRSTITTHKEFFSFLFGTESKIRQMELKKRFGILVWTKWACLCIHVQNDSFENNESSILFSDADYKPRQISQKNERISRQVNKEYRIYEECVEPGST